MSKVDRRNHSLTVYSDLTLTTDPKKRSDVKSQNLTLDEFRILEQDGSFVECDPAKPEDNGLLYTEKGTYQNQSGQWVKVVNASREEKMSDSKSLAKNK